MSHNCKIFDIQFIGDQPYEGGDDVAEPTVSSIGQKVIHLPVNKKHWTQFVINCADSFNPLVGTHLFLGTFLRPPHIC